MDSKTSALLQRAAALRRAGRVQEAIDAYEQLLARDPDLPDCWYNLGWLQRRARRFDDALASYAVALVRGVSGAEEVHLNRAAILSDHLARPGDAEAELKAALKLDPDYVPALLNLGNLHEDRGRRGEARDAYTQALRIEPENALALSRLAGVTDSASDEALPLISQLQDAIAMAERTAAERADLGFALGRLLDARGEYSDSFAAYEAANRASRESFGPRFGGYDRGAFERSAERLIASFASPAAAANESDAPIFIVGMFRSGSTLVERILAGHSGVTAGGELDLVPALVERIAGYPESVAAADEVSFRSWRRFYLDGLAPFARPATLVTDKRPDNFLHVGLIKRLFPDARIVHTWRDRLDNLLSLYFVHVDPQTAPYALDLRDAVHWYSQYERLMAHWKALYPNDIFDIGYDELVCEPKPVIERLLSFLGLKWEDAVLDFHRAEGPVKTASVWQVRESLHTRSSGRWRNYRNELGPLLGQ